MAERKIGGTTMRLVRGDITDMEVEAFVFDISDDLKLGAGYGGAITARGGKSVQEELDAIGACPRGQAVVTGAGNMKAKHIVHVNGPKFREPGEGDVLRTTVLAALNAAEEKGITQLALPPIGSGLYQVPIDTCAKVMVDTVTEHLHNGSKIAEIRFVALDSREYAPLAAALEKGV